MTKRILWFIQPLFYLPVFILIAPFWIKAMRENGNGHILPSDWLFVIFGTITSGLVIILLTHGVVYVIADRWKESAKHE